MNKFKHLFLIVCLVIFAALLFTVPALAQDEPARPSITISVDDVLWIVVGLAGILVGLVSVARKQPQNLDSATVARLEQEQRNREHMERYERLHQQSAQQSKAAFDTLASIVSSIAAITPFNADNALARFMRDIQTPGAPADLPPAPAADKPVSAG